MMMMMWLSSSSLTWWSSWSCVLWSWPALLPCRNGWRNVHRTWTWPEPENKLTRSDYELDLDLWSLHAFEHETHDNDNEWDNRMMTLSSLTDSLFCLEPMRQYKAVRLIPDILTKRVSANFFWRTDLRHETAIFGQKEDPEIPVIIFCLPIFLPFQQQKHKNVLKPRFFSVLANPTKFKI